MTADAQTLREIAERVEKLTGPDREVDLMIATSLNHAVLVLNQEHSARTFTASVDTALTLVPDAEWRVSLDKLPISKGPRWTATIRPHAAEGGWSDYTEAAAIAITAAALRALAASQELRRDG